MTYITQLTARHLLCVYRSLALILSGCTLLLLQSSTVSAQQWNTTGNNINNTNSGSVSVGTTSPGGDKLIVAGNTVGGNITSRTELYSGFDAQYNFVMELGSGTATANIIPYPTFVLSRNMTSTNQFIGTFQFANRNIADGSDKRLAQMTGWTDGAINSGALGFSTTNAGTLTERMRINSAGNVGIGLTNPLDKVHINGVVTNGGGITINTPGNAKYRIGTAGTTVPNWGGQFMNTKYNEGPSNWTLDDTSLNAAFFKLDARSASYGNEIGFFRMLAGTNPRPDSAWLPMLQMRLDTGNIFLAQTSGNVGIGTPTPASKLDVNGNTNITGNLNVTGSINAKYQDMAEWVESSQQLSAGTVVVLDHTKSNQVVASSAAYDTRVAGVISLQPGITLGENGAGKVLVATTGRVRVKADATNAPIQIGDLLVTSDQTGLAMKSEPISIGKRQLHSPGTLIGKALEPLAGGKGEILVLLSLQ